MPSTPPDQRMMRPQLPAQCQPALVKAQDLSPPELPDTGSLSRPILSLRIHDQVLYGELIQEASPVPAGGSRAMLWVRPLWLVSRDITQPGHQQIWNLLETSDLLWPADAFQPAYAEEVLPLIQQSIPLPEARQQLQAFLKRAWQANQCYTC
ncbi:MAG: hypothetical protein NW237_16205 [Cyanobacteriota bacterium]|nr:hypothetical protein [Cyanobacteriota bacterium]